MPSIFKMRALELNWDLKFLVKWTEFWNSWSEQKPRTRLGVGRNQIRKECR